MREMESKRSRMRVEIGDRSRNRKDNRTTRVGASQARAKDNRPPILVVSTITSRARTILKGTSELHSSQVELLKNAPNKLDAVIGIKQIAFT